MRRYGIDTAHIEAPTAALEYARRLSQRGVPATDLVRAYRVGQARFLSHCIDELMRGTEGDHVEGRSTHWMVEHVSDSIDRVVEQVLDAYERARERWVQNRSAVLAMRVRSLLAGEKLDLEVAEAALGHRLWQRHLGVVLWVERKDTDPDPLGELDRAASALSIAAGCPRAC